MVTRERWRFLKKVKQSVIRRGEVTAKISFETAHPLGMSWLWFVK